MSLENTIVTDFEEGVQMNIGVAGRLLVTDSVFRSNKTGINFSAGGTEAHGAAVEHSRFERNDTGIVHSLGNNMIVSNDIDISGAINFSTFLPR